MITKFFMILRYYLRRLFIIMRIYNILVLTLLLVLSHSAYDWSAVQNAIGKAINQGIFSGCVLGVATNNATLLKKAYGYLGPRRGFYSPPVTVDMKFDLGFLTQPVGINAALMELIDKTFISLTNKISFLYSDFDNNGKRYITVQNLLEHNSGLQATYNATLPKTPAELIKAINNLKLQYTTENKTLFSELGPIVLGQVITKLTNKTLSDAFFQILTIAGMRDTVYRPKTDKFKIAPSGFTDHVSWGTPYNRLAHFLNDSAGNAGLFSTVSDVLLYMQLHLNKGQIPNYSRVWSADTVDKFLNVTKYKFNNTRALGWQTIPLTPCPCGKKFSPSPFSFGMSDPPSGSFIWADKKKNVTIVLLANGAFPARAASDPVPYQGQISDAIMTALGY